MDINTKEYDMYPISLMGVCVSVSDVFLPWVGDFALKNGINIDEIEFLDFDDLFFTMQKKYKTIFSYEFFSGSETIFMPEDMLILGVHFNIIPDIKSIKRVRIEIYDDLKRMQLFDDDAELEIIQNYSDIYIAKKIGV